MKLPAYLLALASATFALDSRYRTYGFLNHTRQGEHLPYRVGASGYVPGADFITVGKLDGSSVGPYSTYKKLDAQGVAHTDNAKVAGEFHRLKTGNHIVRSSSSLNSPRVAETNTEVGTKEHVLLQQLEAECQRRPDGKCQSILDYVNQWIQAHNNNPWVPVVFEIANEPNVFPYMTPETYAWYYSLWHDEIKKVWSNTIIMNGGLWCFDGLPMAIRANLSLAGIQINPYINSEGDYFKAFADYLKLLKPANWSDYRPDILNLHFYPYIDLYADSPRGFAGYDGDPVWIGTILFHRFAALNTTIQTGNKFTKKEEVWLTELGNINPIPEAHAELLMESILRGLEGTYDYYKVALPSYSRITRWYWFKATGTDSKFEALDKYDDELQKVGILISLYHAITQYIPGTYALIEIIKNFAIEMVYDIKAPSTSQVQQVVAIAQKVIDNGVPQGLEYQHNNNLSLLGTRYLNSADKTPPAPPPVVVAPVTPPHSCKEWRTKCYATQVFGWPFPIQSCGEYEVAIPCKPKNIAPIVNLLLLN